MEFIYYSKLYSLSAIAVTEFCLLLQAIEYGLPLEAKEPVYYSKVQSPVCYYRLSSPVFCNKLSSLSAVVGYQRLQVYSCRTHDKWSPFAGVHASVEMMKV
jgi:hypothetical protein